MKKLLIFLSAFLISQMALATGTSNAINSPSLANIATVNSAIVATNGSGVGSEVTVLPFIASTATGGTGVNNTPTTGTILRGNGTGFAATTATYPSTGGTAGKILISDGTNIVSSTPTYPNAATSAGTILRADGTNWLASTTTFPDTNAINTIPYASSANVFGSIAAANNGTLQTSASGVPSFSTWQAYTPTIGDGTNNFTGVTTSSSYYKDGGVIFVNIKIAWTGKGSASAGSGVRISLPFTAATTPNRCPFTFAFVSGITATTQLTAGADSGNAYINMFTLTSGGAASGVLVSAMATSGEIQLSGQIGS